MDLLKTLGDIQPLIQLLLVPALAKLWAMDVRMTRIETMMSMRTTRSTDKQVFSGED